MFDGCCFVGVLLTYLLVGLLGYAGFGLFVVWCAVVLVGSLRLFCCPLDGSDSLCCVALRWYLVLVMDDFSYVLVDFDYYFDVPCGFVWMSLGCGLVGFMFDGLGLVACCVRLLD